MNDSVHNNRSHYGEMLEAAKDFCQVIKRVLRCEEAQWLADMVAILRRMQTAMTAPDAPGFELCRSDHSDLDEKFDFFCRLKRRLGKHDAYRMKDDPSQDEEEITGSLAGDLTDIYYELQWGLNRLETEAGSQDDVFRVWQRGYVLHWGQRLVDARRRLLELRKS